MTLTDYNLYVSRIRWHFSDWASKYITAISASGERNRYREYVLNLTGLYLDVLESWFLPTKVVGTTVTGSNTITLDHAITASDYDRYKGHIIVGDGIDDVSVVSLFTSSTIEVSKPAIDAVRAVFTIGSNTVDIEELLGLVASLNIIYKTRYTVDGYWTEFDLDNIESVISSDMLLYGSSSSDLTGANMYISLFKETEFTGGDIDIVYDFSIQHPYFAYPSSIPNLQHIYDPDGDDVLGSFTMSVVNVSFPGGDIVPYKVYKVEWLTTILNETYQFRF